MLPAAGEPGSTAIHMDDPSFVGWASGYENYLVGTDCISKWQTPELALGKALGTSDDIVSLGRGGQITLTFDKPIIDGQGFDFAVFENGLISDGLSGVAGDIFAELAFVEVSSDGVNFIRFNNDSLTETSVGPYGTLDCTDVDGLAGKYIRGYGTPFDLADVNLQVITHVRLVDIVGDGSCIDTSGDVIYDPYPTWESAGFDLDAVGVINCATLPGDANNDGVVNQLDLNTVIDNWQVSGVGWADGDFNDDGVVNQLDLNLAIDNWQSTGSATFASVPEPASLVLFLLVGSVSRFLRKR